MNSNNRSKNALPKWSVLLVLLAVTAVSAQQHKQNAPAPAPRASAPSRPAPSAPRAAPAQRPGGGSNSAQRGPGGPSSPNRGPGGASPNNRGPANANNRGPGGASANRPGQAGANNANNDGAGGSGLGATNKTVTFYGGTLQVFGYNGSTSPNYPTVYNPLIVPAGQSGTLRMFSSECQQPRRCEQRQQSWRRECGQRWGWRSQPASTGGKQDRCPEERRERDIPQGWQSPYRPNSRDDD